MRPLAVLVPRRGQHPQPTGTAAAGRRAAPLRRDGVCPRGRPALARSGGLAAHGAPRQQLGLLAQRLWRAGGRARARQVGPPRDRLHAARAARRLRRGCRRPLGAELARVGRGAARRRARLRQFRPAAGRRGGGGPRAARHGRARGRDDAPRLHGLCARAALPGREPRLPHLRREEPAGARGAARPLRRRGVHAAAAVLRGRRPALQRGPVGSRRPRVAPLHRAAQQRAGVGLQAAGHAGRLARAQPSRRPRAPARQPSRLALPAGRAEAGRAAAPERARQPSPLPPERRRAVQGARVPRVAARAAARDAARRRL
mmetsp:Transcript_7063/g.23320  ORF Transcript_7063/g.23320 Transcript_7063/m.23320 type:complete len:315 (+) Transcript_7063:354-1298(+)